MTVWELLLQAKNVVLSSGNYDNGGHKNNEQDWQKISNANTVKGKQLSINPLFQPRAKFCNILKAF
jgi:hypothetical protein